MINKQVGTLSNGTFGQKKMAYAFFNLHHKVTYVMAHGLYGSSFSDSRYQDLTNKIIKKKLGNVFTYETSRRTKYTKKNSINFAQYQQAFVAKTFKDELEDVNRLFNFLTQHLINKRNSQLIIVAFSLGGTICSFMIPKYKQSITKIFLFGSGISTKGFNKPITSTYPDAQVILENFKHYLGEIYLIQGSQDVVVPLRPARKIITESTQASVRTLTIFKDIDHSFRYLNGKLAIKAINKMIFTYLQKHTIKS